MSYEACEKLADDAGYEERLAYLKTLPSSTMVHGGVLDEVREFAARIGGKIDPTTVFVTYPQVDAGDKNTAMAWKDWGYNKGPVVYPRYWQETSVYDRLRFVIHECVGHGLDPIDPANVRFYGTESTRLAAVAYNEAVAKQCLGTGIYLNAYHQSIAAEWLQKRDEQSWANLLSETWAIHVELTLAGWFSWLHDTWRAQHNVHQPSSGRLVDLGLSLNIYEDSGIGRFLIHGVLYGVSSLEQLHERVQYISQIGETDLRDYQLYQPVLSRLAGVVVRLATHQNHPSSADGFR